MRGLSICSTLLATRARFLDSDAFKAFAHSLSALFCSTYFSQVAVLPRPKLTGYFIQGAVPSREQVHASSGCRCSERSSSHAELSPLNFDGQDRDLFRLQWLPLSSGSNHLLLRYKGACFRFCYREWSTYESRISLSRSHENFVRPVSVPTVFSLLRRCFLTPCVRVEINNHQQTGHLDFFQSYLSAT